MRIRSTLNTTAQSVINMLMGEGCLFEHPFLDRFNANFETTIYEASVFSNTRKKGGASFVILQ
jgi:hypothetical protein